MEGSKQTFKLAAARTHPDPCCMPCYKKADLCFTFAWCHLFLPRPDSHESPYDAQQESGLLNMLLPSDCAKASQEATVHASILKR